MVKPLNNPPFRIRLFFVDCPEGMTTAAQHTDRIREQKRYFGLSGTNAEENIIAFADKAKVFTREQLAAPFKVFRGFYDTANDRYYAFVQTAESDDLAHLLVKNGLARIHGNDHEMPSGLSEKQTQELLHELETAAILRRYGLWAKTEPDKFLELRKQARDEQAENKRVVDAVKTRREGHINEMPPLNPNLASREELDRIPGIGPKTIAKIISCRNEKIFVSYDDFRLRVKPIAPNEKWLKDYLVFPANRTFAIRVIF